MKAGLAVDVLVNGTTVGMKHGPPTWPVSLPLQRLPETASVVDIVYPRPAGGLLDQAQQRGLCVQDGLPMLHWQGVRALELWLGQSLPEPAIKRMRGALLG